MIRPGIVSLFATAMATALLSASLCGTLPAAPLDTRTFDDAFTMSGFGHTMTASGGQLVINGMNLNTDGQFLLPGPGAVTPFTVSTQVGSDAGSPGSFNVGLRVGDNTVVFHPGFGGAALRVSGPGGFGNQNVGFTPAVGVLHTLTVTGNGAGNFTLQLQNGGGPGVYNNAWTNLGNPLTQIGVLRSGPTTVNANYDNLSVPPSPLGGFSQNFTATMGTTANSGTVSAVGGQLRMSATAAATNTFLVPGQLGNLLVSGGVGSTPGSGSTNVGIQVGGNNLVFHPNLATGAFRVDGPGGFFNTAMGFNPAGSVLHNMEVAIDAATGRFTIAVADANNASNVFAARFTNNGYTPGASPIGFRYSSGGIADTGIYDNLAISQLTAATDGNAEWVSAIGAASPRHWYRLSETTSNIAIDSGSAAQHGVYQNGVTKGLAGVTNGAAGFDGVNDQVNLGAADLSGPWTAEFIVNKQGLEAAGSLLISAGGALRLDQWNNTGEVGFTDFGNADFLFAPGVSLEEQFFHFLAFVGDPSDGIDLYVDGQFAGTNPNYIDLPLTAIGGADAANMFLDEVVIFNRALSSDEIYAHADAAGLAVPEPQGLAMWTVAAGLCGVVAWRFQRKRNEAHRCEAA